MHLAPIALSLKGSERYSYLVRMRTQDRYTLAVNDALRIVVLSLTVDPIADRAVFYGVQANMDLRCLFNNRDRTLPYHIFQMQMAPSRPQIIGSLPAQRQLQCGTGHF